MSEHMGVRGLTAVVTVIVTAQINYGVRLGSVATFSTVSFSALLEPASADGVQWSHRGAALAQRAFFQNYFASEFHFNYLTIGHLSHKLIHSGAVTPNRL